MRDNPFLDGGILKTITTHLMLFLLAASACLYAQTTPSAGDLPLPARTTANHANPTATKTAKDAPPAPFTRLAVSGGISLMGINMQAAVNANRYINLRATGNYFSYTMNDRKINDYTVNGNLKFATAGASVDFYPFPQHGLRFSPGLLFYNQNAATANMTVAGGTKLSLNDVDYYSSSTDPIKGTGSFGLNKRNPAFTMTTGWGNLISRRGGHWSFPFELGVAFVDQPQIDVALTSGQACDALGANCVDVATDTTVQSNLQAQIKKYQDDVSLLKFYPILSFGVGYNFRIR
jgi:hypothetical protein